jgi:MFS family permease
MAQSKLTPFAPASETCSIDPDGLHAKSSFRRTAISALAGTSIEFYDFFLYGTAAALVFPTVFFPKSVAPSVALLASFSTFALGFCARPLGAVVFGHFGDRAGRKPTLVAALLLMGTATTLIGCLPGYAVAGPMAPIMLIILRLLQGLALGGQWGGAVLLLTESAPAHRQGFYGSFAQMGAPIGTILANLVFLIVSTLVSPQELTAWAWRIPFLLSLALIAVGLLIQFKLQDTAAFLEVKATRRSGYQKVDMRQSPVVEALRQYPKQIVLAAGAFVAMNVSYYVMVTFLLAYGTSNSGPHLPRSFMLSAVLLGAIAMIPGTFLSCVVSDARGRRPVLMTCAALLGLWAFAIFPLVNTRSWIGVCAAVCIGQFLNGMLFGPLAALFSEMFPASVRYSGASLGYQFGAILGGALAPLVATALLLQFRTPLAISAYMVAMCGITITSVWLIRERRPTEVTQLAWP